MNNRLGNSPVFQTNNLKNTIEIITMEKNNVRKLIDFINKNRDIMIMFLTLLKNCKKKEG